MFPGRAQARRGAGHRLDSDDGRLGAGHDLAGGGRARAWPPAAARRGQHSKFSSGPEVVREQAAEERVGRSQLGCSEGEPFADSLPGLGMPHGWGSRRGIRSCGTAHGRTSFASGDHSRTRVPRSTRGPAGRRHCERRRGTARGRDSYTRQRAGIGPALRAGGPAGLAPRRWAGDRSQTRCLARPAGRLGAGRQGGEGERAACGLRAALPQGNPGGLAGHLQPEPQRGGGPPVAGRAAWRPETRRRASRRASEDRWPEKGISG